MVTVCLGDESIVTRAEWLQLSGERDMGGSAAGAGYRHLVSNIPMCLNADGGGVAVSAEFRYTTRDPYAVQVTFCRPGFNPVVWAFARDLLVVGLARPVGLGDVRIAPQDSSVVLSLSSPEGTAQLAAQATDVHRFVSRMLDVIPLGAESTFLDIDAEIAHLNGAIAAGGEG